MMRRMVSSAITRSASSYSRLSPSTSAQLRPLGVRSFFSSVDFDPNSEYPRRYRRRTGFNIGIRVVPQQQACVIERFGEFEGILTPGIHFLIPLVQKIAYIHSLKEQAIRIPNQAAVTSDNVSLHIDGVLFVKVVDPKKASYGVDDPIFAITQLAQTSMRSAIGKMTLDRTFMERSTLNAMILEAINGATTNWGLECIRYEIRDITPPPGIRRTMEKQAEAERSKRAEVLEAEGKRQSIILKSEARRQAVILESEAAEVDEINRARGKRQAAILEAEGRRQALILEAEGNGQAAILEAEGKRKAVILESQAAEMDEINRQRGNAEGLKLIAKALAEHGEKFGGEKAVSLRIAEKYLQSYNNLAKEATTMLLPSSTVSDPSSMMSTAIGLYKKMIVDQSGKTFSDSEPTTIGVSVTDSTNPTKSI